MGLADQACALVRLLVKKHGKPAVLEGEDVVQVSAATGQHDDIAYLDVLGEEISSQDLQQGHGDATELWCEYFAKDLPLYCLPLLLGHGEINLRD